MSKDDRLYARFDIGMHEHAKIMLLSDSAFRALIEATLYARRQLTDGFLAEGVVVRMWGREAADELTSNHPERPSWVRVEGGWEIRDYSEHQITRADIEAKREAGRAGGLAKASRKLAHASEVLEQKASTCLAKTETETETKELKSVAPRKRGERIPEPFIVTKLMREWAMKRVPGVDINVATEKFVNYWRAQTRNATKLDWIATWNNWLLSDFERNVQNRKPTPEERAHRTLALATDIDTRELSA